MLYIVVHPMEKHPYNYVLLLLSVSVPMLFIAKIYFIQVSGLLTYRSRADLNQHNFNIFFQYYCHGNLRCCKILLLIFSCSDNKRYDSDSN